MNKEEKDMYDIHDWDSIYDYYYEQAVDYYGSENEDYNRAYARTQADLYYIEE